MGLDAHRLGRQRRPRDPCSPAVPGPGPAGRGCGRLVRDAGRAGLAVVVEGRSDRRGCGAGSGPQCRTDRRAVEVGVVVADRDSALDDGRASGRGGGGGRLVRGRAGVGSRGVAGPRRPVIPAGGLVVGARRGGVRRDLRRARRPSRGGVPGQHQGGRLVVLRLLSAHRGGGRSGPGARAGGDAAGPVRHSTQLGVGECSGRTPGRCRPDRPGPRRGRRPRSAHRRSGGGAGCCRGRGGDHGGRPLALASASLIPTGVHLAAGGAVAAWTATGNPPRPARPRRLRHPGRGVGDPDRAGGGSRGVLLDSFHFFEDEMAPGLLVGNRRGGTQLGLQLAPLVGAAAIRAALAVEAGPDARGIIRPGARVARGRGRDGNGSSGLPAVPGHGADGGPGSGQVGDGAANSRPAWWRSWGRFQPVRSRSSPTCTTTSATGPARRMRPPTWRPRTDRARYAPPWRSCPSGPRRVPKSTSPVRRSARRLSGGLARSGAFGSTLRRR